MARRNGDSGKNGTFIRNGAAGNGGWQVLWHPDAQKERKTLVKNQDELVAIRAATIKLKELGTSLSSPHQSKVRGTKTNIRELRPRGGDSPWRCLYSQVGSRTLLILAVAHDGQTDKRRFKQALGRAERRLKEIRP